MLDDLDFFDPDDDPLVLEGDNLQEEADELPADDFSKGEDS